MVCGKNVSPFYFNCTADSTGLEPISYITFYPIKLPARRKTRSFGFEPKSAVLETTVLTIDTTNAYTKQWLLDSNQ